jgi:hypothetical protein
MSSAVAPPKLRRRPAVAAAGVALMALGALAAATLASGGSTPVLVMSSTVLRGEIIEAADLAVAQTALDDRVRALPASERESVVGARAVADLLAGSLLPPAAVSREAFPPPGSAVVPVAATPSQAPAGLAPGDRIRIVATPRVGDDFTTGPGVATAGVVAAVAEADPAGRRTINVLVDVRDAEAVAALAATERVAVVLDSPAED